MKYNRNFTDAQKKDWIQKAKEKEKEATHLIHSIGQNYRDNPECIAEMLRFSASMYQYSFKNTKLIYAQNPYATYVQSFEAWKKMGYSVLAKEKSMMIFVPVKSTILTLPDGSKIPLSEATKEQKALYKDGKLESVSTTRFKMGNVFDISQTNFPKEKYPELFSVGYPSSMHYGICKGLEDFAKQIGYTVSYEDLNSIALRGTCNYYDKLITVNNKLEDTQRLSTLSHELGHALEHHNERPISSAQKEFEADAISILIQSNFGIELTDSRKSHLAQHYKKFKDELRECLPEGQELDDDVLIEQLDQALAASLDIFKLHINQINECVERYVPQERLLEYERKEHSYLQDICKNSGVSKAVTLKNMELDNEFDFSLS